MRIGQTSTVYFVSKVIGSALGFVATIYFARLLGEEVLGFYSLSLALVAWLSVIGKVGLSGAITKRVSEGEDQEAYITAGALMIGSLFVVIASLLITFQEYVNEYVGAPVAVFILLIVFADLLRTVSFSSLQGSHLVHVYGILATVKIGLRSLVQIALVFVGWRLTGMLVGYAVGGIVMGLFGLWILGFRPSVPKRRHFSTLFDFAKFSWLGGMRSKTFDSVDIIVLGVFVQAGLVGIYSVAWAITKFLDLFGDAISTTVFPEMSDISSREGVEAVSGLIEETIMYAGLFLIPGVIGSAVISDRLLRIYGEGFAAGATILVILLFAMLIYAYNQQLLSTLNAINRPDLAFRANAVFILTNLVLNIFLVTSVGWIGAAVATALSAAIGLIVSFHYTRSIVAFSIPIRMIGYQVTAAGIMGGVVYFGRIFGENHWVAAYNAAFVVLLVALGAGVYFGTLLAISSTFRTTVTNNLPFDIPFVTN
ncbi:oligosaccharide flippase family protein [Natronorubrum sp. DTA7]|uniref:oligosaccharide flippase family protein n=1 Tax=Natronorubrum sp. DTA7 TaxID=3447016 RepID=UPI003F83BE42